MAGPTTASLLNCYKPTGKRRVGAERETTRTGEAEQRGQLTLALPPGLAQPRALSGLREEGGQRPSARSTPAEERAGPRGVPGPRGASCSRCCCPVRGGRQPANRLQNGWKRAWPRAFWWWCHHRNASGCHFVKVRATSGARVLAWASSHLCNMGRMALGAFANLMDETTKSP